jgi:ubiquinone/menaquinone biosynthesis C-methylase UbiE
MVLTMGERTCAVLALAMVLAGACSLPAQPAPPSDDATSTHDFADVRYWSSVFDDPARDAWQKPKELVAALDIRRGSVVADLGAGTGYLSRRLADAVGPDGTVLAVETEPNLVAHLRERAAGEKTPNVVPVLASPSDPRLPAGGVDLILVVDTYHHIDDRRTYVPALRRFLRPGGRVAVVDWQRRELPVGPPMDHKLAREQVVDEMQASGFTLAAEHTMLPYQYFLVFTQATPPDSPGTPTR